MGKKAIKVIYPKQSPLPMIIAIKDAGFIFCEGCNMLVKQPGHLTDINCLRALEERKWIIIQRQ